MKSASIFVFVFLFFACVNTERTINNMAMGLSRAFSISKMEVDKCISKTKATAHDFLSFEDAIGDSSEETNNNTEMIRRAACATVCCAQVQGTMVGAEIQLPLIHRIIQESGMSLIAQHNFRGIVISCHNQVKDIKDECETGYRFMKCLVLNYRDAREE